MGIFDELDSISMQAVWDELTDRFGFPQKTWKAEFRQFLEKQPRDVHEASAFLTFGNKRINPILNSLLLRSPGRTTFNDLVIYVIHHKKMIILKT